MNNDVVYYVSMALVGAIVLLTGLRNILTEGVTVSSGLMATGGLVLLAGTALLWFDSTKPEPGWATWVAALGGLLVLLGSLALLFG